MADTWNDLMSWLTALNRGGGWGLEYGAPFTAKMRPQPPLNQANPYTTYVSPNTPQPAGAVPVVGQTGTQSGPPVHATYGPPAPDLTVTARRYRAQHGLATADDAATEALNTESLQAAQAGRTYLDRTLAAQYGQTPAASAWGPRLNVVNALSAPPATAQPVVAQQQPLAVAQNNLLQQGIY